jgi:hypothetical protein
VLSCGATLRLPAPPFAPELGNVRPATVWTEARKPHLSVRAGRGWRAQGSARCSGGTRAHACCSARLTYRSIPPLPVHAHPDQCWPNTALQATVGRAYFQPAVLLWRRMVPHANFGRGQPRLSLGSLGCTLKVAARLHDGVTFHLLSAEDRHVSPSLVAARAPRGRMHESY